MLSILYLRCHVAVDASEVPKLPTDLSILYLRCEVSLLEVAVASEELSILYLRCARPVVESHGAAGGHFQFSI